MDYLNWIDGSVGLQVRLEFTPMDLLPLVGAHLTTLSFIHIQLLTIQSFVTKQFNQIPIMGKFVLNFL